MTGELEKMGRLAGEAIHDYDTWQRALAALRMDGIEPRPTFWQGYKYAVDRVYDSAKALAQVLPDRQLSTAGDCWSPPTPITDAIRTLIKLGMDAGSHAERVVVAPWVWDQIAREGKMTRKGEPWPPVTVSKPERHEGSLVWRGNVWGVDVWADLGTVDTAIALRWKL